MTGILIQSSDIKFDPVNCEEFNHLPGNLIKSFARKCGPIIYQEIWFNHLPGNVDQSFARKYDHLPGNVIESLARRCDPNIVRKCDPIIFVRKCDPIICQEM